MNLNFQLMIHRPLETKFPDVLRAFHLQDDTLYVLKDFQRFKGCFQKKLYFCTQNTWNNDNE